MDKITLKPTAVDDLPFLRDLWNDGRVMKWVGFPNGTGATDDSMMRWFEKSKSWEPPFGHFIVNSGLNQKVFKKHGCSVEFLCFGIGLNGPDVPNGPNELEK